MLNTALAYSPAVAATLSPNLEILWSGKFIWLCKAEQWYSKYVCSLISRPFPCTDLYGKEELYCRQN